MDDRGIPVFGHKRPAAQPAEMPPPAMAPGEAAVQGGTPPALPQSGLVRAHAPGAVALPRSNLSDADKIWTICLETIEASTAAALPPERLRHEVEKLISQLGSEQHIQMNNSEQHELAGAIVDDMIGLGPLEPLLRDENISDILVNGPDHTFVERNGKLTQVPVHFRNWEHLTNICQRIAASIGRHVDESSPMVDARLQDGSRVNIVLPPLTLDGPAIAIRKFSRKAMDFARLIEFGSVTPTVAGILEICARCRLNIIISGGTGSGKTTLMNAMSHFIDPAERIITVEDVAELQLDQPDLVRMETKPLNIEGKGEVTTRDLVRNALRMRPDRIIVGEVRGGEAFDMLQAMNTGHAGSLSTIHANSCRDALARIENMVQMSAMGLSSKSIRTEIVGAINLIIQLDRQRDGVRRVTEVVEIAGIEDDKILLGEIFRFKVTGETEDGHLIGQYGYSRIRPVFFEQLEYFNLAKHWTDVMKAAADDPRMVPETGT